ncbi:thioredoxin family protein [Desulfobotulus sp.]|jgi:thioredoxin-related protein|uniref:thioredoxin family protein n=1 Tax=Desulfobotulus sp. TaxID=1940337 RepID=UPI002A36AC47|nr:thioredoxin family protein [Desulfobotulus sp.]MDY0162588.1 thioredoxin family protein [Desulfobotulus sp.]
MSIFHRLTLTLLFLFMASLASAQSLAWTPHNKALEQAAQEEKKVYFYFQSSQCSWCRTMEEKTLADAEVIQYLNTHFISARIDVDRNTAFARKFRVSGVPAHIFLSSGGEGLFSRPGYVPPETFLRILKILNTGNHEK